MKKLIYLLAVTIIIFTGCSTNNDNSSSEIPTSPNSKTYEVKSNGYGGELSLNVTLNGEKIQEIKVITSHESSPVWNRAFPLIRERILNAQSPIVDNVSGATLTSYAVKSAVADACKQNGKDFGKITVNTEPTRGTPTQLEDVTTDIVIIGGGSSGLSAAISAKENGVENIIVIEKLDILSGNGKFNMNYFDHYNTKAQESANNTMTKEDFIKLKENVSDTPERVQAWADEGYNLDAWLRGMGIELNYNYGDTNHMAEEDEYAGEHIQDKIESKVKELGIDVRTGTKGVDLIIENGKAIGIKVETRDGYYTINASAVIVATGGFSANKDLLAINAPGSERLATSNQMGATGDFIPVFEANNIKMQNLDSLSIFPIIIKNRRDLTGAGDGFILVNKEGKRFIDEQKREMELATAIIDQPDSTVFYLYDQNLYESSYRLKKHNDLGYHVKADTIEELATLLGVDSANLKASVESFNSGVRGEVKDQFRETAFDKELRAEGPYYGVQVESAVHQTKGGVVANEKAEVISNDNTPVEFLYAAGDVTDTSGAYSSSMVFGKIAGREAAIKIMNK